MNITYENKRRQISLQRRKYLGCSAHLHKEIEVVYMLSGETRALVDSRAYTLRAGDLFCAFPNQVHSYDSYAAEDSFLLIFSPEFFPDYASFLLKKMPCEPVIKKEAMPKDFKNIIQRAHKARISEQQFGEEIFKGYISVMLGMLLPCFNYENVHNANTDMLSAVLAYCMQNYRESISLDSMAKDLHSSKYYISHLFSEKIKIGFNDYISTLRINDAKERLLNTDDSITQIGISVGYNSIRSFNRAFLAQTQMQPREYRAKFAKNN